MCGRARLPQDYSEIKRQIEFGEHRAAPNLMPTWNLAPTQGILTCVRDPVSGERAPVKMRWGLIPGWAKEAKMKFATFNARSETLETTASFRDAWKKGRRCLVITDGFYEWRKGDTKPYAIACVNDRLTVMAGLWDEWKGPTGEVVLSCTIITTHSNELMQPLHDRMPVILDEKDWPAWLGEVETSFEDLKKLLVPFPSEEMHLWPVDKRVGNVRNDDPSLVLEATDIGPLL
jgi:putative SOS response-associated peptidase YedK